MCCPFPFFLFVVGCLFVCFFLCVCVCVCLCVCGFFCFYLFIYLFFVLFCVSFIKFVLFKFLARLSISLTYLNLHKCNSLLYINPRLYKHFLHFLISQ